MLKALVVALCVGQVTGCRRPDPSPVPGDPAQPAYIAAAPEPPPELQLLFWSTLAESGTGPLVQLRQTATARNHCRAEVTMGGEPRWSVEACIATRLQLRFLSSDGERVLILDPAPEIDKGGEGGPVSLGTLWHHGRLAGHLTAASLGLASSQARVDAGVVRWLGERDQRPLSDGVEVQLLDGSLRTLHFDGADVAPLPKPVPVEAPTTTAVAASCHPCSYTDDSGTYHVVETAEEIPAQYRGRAGRITGVVNRADAAAPAPHAMPAARPQAEAAPSGLTPEQLEAALDVGRPETRKPLNREKNHFERVHDLIAPGERYDPERKVKCRKPGGEEIPCPD